MTLRNQLLAVVGAVALASFSVAEWHQSRYASAAVAQCLETAAPHPGDSHVSALCGSQRGLLREAAFFRWGSYAFSLAALWLAGWIWTGQRLERPLRQILQRIRVMEMGRSGPAHPDDSLPLAEPGETGEIAKALCTLEERLDAEAGSRKSATLLATRAESRLGLMGEYLCAVREITESARLHQQLPPRRVIENLLFVEREVLELRRSLRTGNREEPGQAPDNPGQCLSFPADRPDSDPPFSSLPMEAQVRENSRRPQMQSLAELGRTRP